MDKNLILECLICFFLGYLIARIIRRGNGLSIGGQKSPAFCVSRHIKDENGKRDMNKEKIQTENECKFCKYDDNLHKCQSDPNDKSINNRKFADTVCDDLCQVHLNCISKNIYKGTGSAKHRHIPSENNVDPMCDGVCKWDYDPNSPKCIPKDDSNRNDPFMKELCNKCEGSHLRYI